MPRLPVSEQLVRRAVASQRSSAYVCRQCLAHQSRTLHTTASSQAEEPFWKRLQKTVFGSKDSDQEVARRESATDKKFRDLEAKGELGKIRTFRDDFGVEWEEAPVVDPTVIKDYVPATSGEGLERIGGQEWVRRRKDRGEVYVGFAPKNKIELSDAEWRGVLHHVAVEVLALYQAGRDLDEVCYPRDVDFVQWMRTASVEIAEANGEISLQFQNEADQALLLGAIPSGLAPEVSEEAMQDEADTAMPDGTEAPEVNEAAMQEEVSVEISDSTVGDAELDKAAKMARLQIKHALASSDARPNLQLSLSDPRLKLAILRRTIQLTGHRIPDYALSNSTTLSDLYQAFRTKPRPAKLHQDRKLQKVNDEVPNVTVWGKRRGPIAKEKEVGRWKVIEEELWKRGLPITGSRWQGAKLDARVRP